jgi:DNA repair protein SbcD/Mre11
VHGVRILHTSDWHLGRTFHGHQTLGAAGAVLAALADEVRRRSVDVVLVAGDVFDSAAPSAAALDALTGALRALRAAGAQVVLTSGNHDSVTRLGLHAEWLGAAGIHLVTRFERLDEPVVLRDEHGPVHVYGIPYLEPAIVRGLVPDEPLRTHGEALTWAMDRIRADAERRGGRSVVLAHCFAAEVRAEVTDVERDIVQGGLNLVSTDVFDGPDYVALGHIHGRSTLTPRVRYSGAPLHYSFEEGHKPRGGWLVDLAAPGTPAEVTWLDLPVPRRLVTLTGPIESLLSDAEHDRHRDSWVRAVVTDTVRPLDAMRRLQQRFPSCAAVEWAPAERAEGTGAGYRERVRGRTDDEILDGFLGHVRNGVGASDFERTLVGELLGERRVREISA